jgi:hypothetical protein
MYCYDDIYCNTRLDGDHYPVTLNILKIVNILFLLMPGALGLINPVKCLN